MQLFPGEASSRVEKETTDLTDHARLKKEPTDFTDNVHSISSPSDYIDCGETKDTDYQYMANTCKELVLYEPVANGAGEIEPITQPNMYQPPVLARNQLSRRSRVLPSVGAFTVQCANCFKWRIIPTKEKYEEIREHILEQPFYCDTASEWRPDISCDDPTDLSQDGSRLWAIDKPSIAQPPRGWQRLLRIRGEGSTKFADIYYVAPSGKTLRSMVEIQKYLMEHPEYLRDVVTMSQFSFQTPRPLREDYVRKRPARIPASCESTSHLQRSEVSALTWSGPTPGNDAQPQIGSSPPPSPPEFPTFLCDYVDQPAKKQACERLSKMYNSKPTCDQPQSKLDENFQYGNSH
ncbi:hypothetical protein K2173_017763 [Erythroxylum novogranatense]|uniref:Uncharacterized protein n=1 Tax=Erythroxylum novogranatense TaxID=1862640 RepID=A0AAV8SMD9_9ROSI|nr:hypothetical protein K2173_017763 [Erythroxylum novogranatense]